MKALIKVEIRTIGDRPIQSVSARELHAFLESSTRLKRVELSKNACNSLALTDWMGRSPMVRISTLIKAFIGFSLFLRPRPEFRQFLQPVLECAGFQANHLASVVFFC